MSERVFPNRFVPLFKYNLLYDWEYRIFVPVLCVFCRVVVSPWWTSLRYILLFAIITELHHMCDSWTTVHTSDFSENVYYQKMACSEIISVIKFLLTRFKNKNSLSVNVKEIFQGLKISVCMYNKRMCILFHNILNWWNSIWPISCSRILRCVLSPVCCTEVRRVVCC